MNHHQAPSSKHEAVMRKAAAAIRARGHEGDARLSDSLLGILAAWNRRAAPTREPGLCEGCHQPMSKHDALARCPAPTSEPGARDAWVSTKEGLPLPESYARILYEGWKAQSGIELAFDAFVGKYGYFLSLDSIGACWGHYKGGPAIRAALATPASPAVPQKPYLSHFATLDEYKAAQAVYEAAIAPPSPSADQAKRLVGGEVVPPWISVDFMMPHPDVEVLIAGHEGVEVARYSEAEEDQVDQMGHDAGFWGYKFAACGRSFGAPDYIRPAQGQPKWWMHLPGAPDEDEADDDAPDRASTGSTADGEGA